MDNKRITNRQRVETIQEEPKLEYQYKSLPNGLVSGLEGILDIFVLITYKISIWLR